MRLLAPAALALTTLLTACSAPLAGPQASAATPVALAASPALWIAEGSAWIPLENGQPVHVGAMAVEVFLAPYPPGRAVTLDLYLRHASVPIEDATVTLVYDHTIMDHGPFVTMAKAGGRGHYLAPLEFVMSGDFWVHVDVQAAGSRSLIRLVVRAQR